MSLFADRSYSRVMVFIDYRNLMSKYNDGSMVADIFRLTQILVGNRDLVGAYIFDGKIPEKDREPKEQAALNELRSLGFRLVTREAMVWRNGRYEQKEVDVSLAVEMMEHALMNHFDVAIVVSGDRDYVPAIEMVQDLGKRVEVASFRGCIGTAMMNAGDQFIDMDTLPILKMDCIPTDLSEVIEWSA